jgi:hypothetical protein
VPPSMIPEALAAHLPVRRRGRCGSDWDLLGVSPAVAVFCLPAASRAAPGHPRITHIRAWWPREAQLDG